MKDKMLALLDGMTESEIAYAFTFLSKLFGKG